MAFIWNFVCDNHFIQILGLNQSAAPISTSTFGHMFEYLHRPWGTRKYTSGSPFWALSLRIPRYVHLNVSTKSLPQLELGNFKKPWYIAGDLEDSVCKTWPGKKEGSSHASPCLADTEVLDRQEMKAKTVDILPEVWRHVFTHRSHWQRVK